MKIDRKAVFAPVKRVVVKIGSGLLTEAAGLNLELIKSISRQICELIKTGHEVVLVSSGAMASGLRKMEMAKRPDEIPKRQAIAAVGQAGLIMEYEKSFETYGRKVAQILLTSDDVVNRKRYLNARNTLYTLLDWQVVPIINENDTVRVEEIKLGDNDNLAALITLLLDADMLINLTDIDGLYDKDPRSNDDAALLNTIATIGKETEAMASGIAGPLGLGGMLSKIKAAKKVTAAGIPMVIANGHTKDILVKLFEGKNQGSFFVPKKQRLASRKRWIAFTLKPKGAIVVDAGAARALVKDGRSLLPSGITAVSGDFKAGAPVALKTADSRTIAMGLVNYSAADIEKIKGLNSRQIKTRLGYKPYDEIIHRNNMVLT